jgi:hypothetical protein
MPSGRNSCKRKEPLLKRKSRRVADAMIPIRMSGSIVVGLPGSGLSRQATAGQRATFTDASPVFVLNVRNQEANPAAGGQNRPVVLVG